MPEKTFIREISRIASVSALALVLTGCAALPAPAPISAVTYRGCLVTEKAPDAIGINEVADYALKQAVVTYGVKRTVLKSSRSKFAANSAKLISQGCDLLVVSGQNFDVTLANVAKSNPKVNFLYLAETPQPTLLAENLDNVAVYQIDLYEAGLLVGDLAASMSDQHTVAIGCTRPELTDLVSGIRDGVIQYSSETATTTEFNVGVGAPALSSMRIGLGCDGDFELNSASGLSAETRIVGFGQDLYLNPLLSEQKKFVAATVIPNIRPRILEVIGSDLEGDFIGGRLGSMVATFGNGGLIISAEHEVAYPSNELKRLEQIALNYEVTLK